VLTVARGSFRYQFYAVKWPEEEFGFGGIAAEETGDGGRVLERERKIWTFIIQNQTDLKPTY
jgi:hypothetical protein